MTQEFTFRQPAQITPERLNKLIARFGSWFFYENGARNAFDDYIPQQFYFQSDDAGAIFRAQGVDSGVGAAVGFFTTGYSSAGQPPVLVMHSDQGTRAAPAAVTSGRSLGVWSMRGTIDGTGLQAVGANIRAVTTEDASVTGKLGSEVQVQVTNIGQVTPSSVTFTINPDTGLKYKTFQLTDSSGNVFSAMQGRNYCDNPGFDVWQAGTTFAVAAGTDTQLADRWKTRRTTANMTISRQVGFSGAQYCLRQARDSGTSDVVAMQLFQHLPTERVRQLAGRTIYVSCDIRCGANYSGGTVGLTWYSGTAGGEALTMSGAGIGFTTGAVATGNGNLGTPTTTATRVVGGAFTVPSNALDLALRFNWTPTGTAGAADWIEITNVRIAEDNATVYRPHDVGAVIQECLRYYQKSFALGTTPAQNIGTGTGEQRFTAVTAGATTQRPPSVRFATPMRAAPTTVTLFNPSAANAQVRDITAAADCSASATTNISENGFDITATGAAGTAAGNSLAVHWVADARL